MNREEIAKQKERETKLKELREEIEEKLEEQLPDFMKEGWQDAGARHAVPLREIDENLDPARAKQVIEALLFASSKPMTAGEIKKVVGASPRGRPANESGRAQGPAPTSNYIENMIHELRDEYNREGRSFELLEIAGGYEIATRKEFAPWILKVELARKAKQVTQSALETVAILAYRQPVTRAEIEELRGVDVSGVLNTLTERGLIKIVGRKEIPGRPFLYGTTDKFLEHFGLKSLEDLPNIQEIKNLVESSVKREELLGTTKMVDVPQEDANEPEQPSRHPEERSDEGSLDPSSRQGGTQDDERDDFEAETQTEESHEPR